MIVEATFVGDFGDRPIGFDEQPRGGGDAGLHDKLVRRETEDAFNQARETDRRQAREFR